MADELVNIPHDLKLMGDQELHELESSATTEVNRLNENDNDVSSETLERLMTLESGITRLRNEIVLRNERSKREEEALRSKFAREKEAIMARVNGEPEPDHENDPINSGNSQSTEEIAAAAAQGVTAALIAVMGDKGIGRDLTEMSKRATATLADARKHAPVQVVPKQTLAVTAGVDIPGLARGSDLNNIDALTDAFHRRARGMPVTRNGQGNEQLVASIRNEFEHTVDDRTSPSQVEELFKHLTTKDKQDSLVAGGGWCAPSEIRYDFFNIACEDGMIDLPTFGVSRGGVRFPVSPSLADANLAPFGVAFTNSSNPWLWTETDDENTVTGSPNKPCVRVPCPSFSEQRLECYGICLTAGNLTDDAYPEATQNFLRLLMSAHQHATNSRYLATMESLSGVAVTGGLYAQGGPAFNAILSSASLAATDYRTKHGMCADDVVEVVLPRWTFGVVQADLARRSGVEDLLSVSLSQVQGYFSDRNIRVQWVNDWQVRGTNEFGDPVNAKTDWPTSVDMMVYAAGTFLLGNGLALDLGVIRDSVLNAENDHTAAWSEECHLIAQVGHESRLYTVAFDVAGDTCCTTIT